MEVFDVQADVEGDTGAARPVDRLALDDRGVVKEIVIHALTISSRGGCRIVGIAGALAGRAPGVSSSAGGTLQERGHLIGVALGQGVDDARSREVGKMLDKPGQPLGRAGKVDDLQPEAGPGERSTVGADRVRVPGELLDDILDDTVVCGGRGAEL